MEGGELGVLPDPGQVVLLRGGLHEGEGALEGLFQQVHPGLVEKGVVHPVGGVPAGGVQLLLGEQALRRQLVQVDEEGISRKGGGGHVGGVAVPRGDQGQDLPVGLTGLGQKIYKAAGGRSQRADAIGPRQGGDGQQHAAETGIIHGKQSPFRGYTPGFAGRYVIV